MTHSRAGSSHRATASPRLYPSGVIDNPLVGGTAACTVLTASPSRH